jgi:hypothetical protein
MARVEVVSRNQTIGEISCLQLHTKETELIMQQIQQTRKQLLSKIPWKVTVAITRQLLSRNTRI